jgi:hypothetical protein
MYNTAVLDGIIKAFNPNSSQVTVLGVNDENIRRNGNPGYVFDAIENTIQLQQR